MDEEIRYLLSNCCDRRDSPSTGPTTAEDPFVLVDVRKERLTEDCLRPGLPQKAPPKRHLHRLLDEQKTADPDTIPAAATPGLSGSTSSCGTSTLD